jgi:hypothetical protein
MKEASPMINAQFFRIHIDEIAYYTKRPKGLFAAIGNLVDQKVMSQSETTEYWRNREWFEGNLPIPPFYCNLKPEPPITKPILPITWYKNNALGTNMFSKMSFYIEMARKYDRKLYVTSTEEIPGEVVYEDDFQIGVINSKHEGHGFTTILFTNLETQQNTGIDWGELRRFEEL